MSYHEERYELFLKIKNDATEEAIKMLQNSRLLTVNSSLNNFEWTSLHLAAYQGNTQLVKYLLENGANLMAVNRSGYTPFMLAESRNHNEIAEYLQLMISRECVAVA